MNMKKSSVRYVIACLVCGIVIFAVSCLFFNSEDGFVIKSLVLSLGGTLSFSIIMSIFLRRQ